MIRMEFMTPDPGARSGMAHMDATQIYQVAKVWMSRHGSRAGALAVDMAKQCLTMEDDRGAASWIAIALAIDDLPVDRGAAE
jgi:hypothetical protein